ncbi:MAG: hypothetical protein CM1200mP41_14600 [Gammaproteobacteria bacterium]|nr:MAG: hypothetical protein CM1200mP41_14600 [Gammaproteobacteria bacterium]
MRMMTHIRVLFDPSVEKTVVGTCFSETTTLGLRVSNVRRQVLIRNPHSVTRDGQNFSYKGDQATWRDDESKTGDR